MKQTLEEAIHAHYNCNGEYPCGERNYCEHCNGHNTAFDCCECGADEFKEGFLSGAEWQAKQSPWISVEDRLPKANTMVLTKGAYGFLICYLSTLGEWETGANVNEERLGITYWMYIPSFDEILEANRDVLERIKEKGD